MTSQNLQHSARDRALFRRIPRLADLVPWVPLADGLPTPVERLDEGLWIKRDDLTDSTYGGNKVRKLEHVLGIAARRGGPVLTAGATGSHHVYATAVHACRLGLSVEAVRFPQPLTDHVTEVDAALGALGVEETLIPHSHLMPFALAAREAMVARRRGTVVLPGATSPLGILGYVGAAFEIVAQAGAAGMHEPDDVVCALGSGGTAVGLSIGFGVAGWSRARVVGVRTADAIVTNRVALLPHVVGTLSLLAMGGVRATPGRLFVDGRWLGPGYGHPTAAGDAASARAAELGVELEPTYTAKAFAAALALVDAGRQVLFVHSYAGSTSAHLGRSVLS